MKYYVSYKNFPISKNGREYPCLVLHQDGWDDYSRKTMFRLKYELSPEKSKSVGDIKIMTINDNDGYDKDGYLIIDNNFDKLPEGFYSLGQDIGFYNSLKSYFPEAYEGILDDLNDLVSNPGLIEEVEDNPIFKSSLIRFSEAEKALRQGQRVLAGEAADDPFYFKFACKVGSATIDHNAEFSFQKKSPLPERIMAIVGNNGTGKTQYLAKMALALSGEKEYGSFEPSRPPFSKIIAVSYSAFDKFERPGKRRTFSYVYCGLKDKEGFLTAKRLEARYQASVSRIKSENRQHFWFSVLRKIINEEQLESIREELFDKGIFYTVAHNSGGLLSSGQSILMYVVTEILANIREQSLILFDEPEMHLHPNAIAKLIKMINALLQKYDSYAILATHSPIIIQEIPSKCVLVFEREGSTPWVRKLNIESFGENISTITKHVFETINTRQNYKDVLDGLAKDNSFDQVSSWFGDRLSLNASIYLKGLYGHQGEKP